MQSEMLIRAPLGFELELQGAQDHWLRRLGKQVGKQRGEGVDGAGWLGVGDGLGLVDLKIVGAAVEGAGEGGGGI